MTVVVRELVGLDQVLAPQLDRIHVELVGGHVEDALDQRGRLGTARAAVRAHGRAVGERDDDVEADLRDVVHGLRHRARRAHRERAAEPAVRAGVADHAAPHAGDRAVTLEPELDVLDLRAAVRHPDHVLGARLDPADRPVQLARDPSP